MGNGLGTLEKMKQYFLSREKFASTTRISTLIAVHSCLPLPLASSQQNKRLGCVESTPTDRLFSELSLMVCLHGEIVCIFNKKTALTQMNPADILRGEISQKKEDGYYLVSLM